MGLSDVCGTRQPNHSERLKFTGRKVAFYHLKDMNRELDCTRAERLRGSVGQALSPASLPEPAPPEPPSPAPEAAEPPTNIRQLTPRNVPDDAPPVGRTLCPSADPREAGQDTGGRPTMSDRRLENCEPFSLPFGTRRLAARLVV